MSKRLLIVSPHPDDETLGAGGTIAKFVDKGYYVKILTISGHLPPLYSRDHYEKTEGEAKKAFEILGINDFDFLQIPATMIGSQPIHEVNGKIMSVIKKTNPHIVLCPFPDRHIDHRLVFDSVMVATRPVDIGRSIEIVAAYETLSETHWNAPNIEPNFTPNWVVDITKYINKKLEALKCYESQIPPFPGSRSIEAAEALAKFRGTQAGFAFGEAFQLIRMVG
jgi:LmbE family N-acetylglucosaminyl deacetylase